MSLKLGVLVSGEGSNLQALIDSIKKNELSAKIVFVASNKPEIPALKRAEKAGIPCQFLNPAEFFTRESYDEAAAQEFLKRGAQLILLAGFMRILSTKFLSYFPGAVINIHPALLPDNPEENEIILPDGTTSKVFRGSSAVKQALEAGTSWSGCTIHLVTEKVDAGPVLIKKPIKIYPDDTIFSLHSRIQEQEHILLPLGIQVWMKKRLTIC